MDAKLGKVTLLRSILALILTGCYAAGTRPPDAWALDAPRMDVGRDAPLVMRDVFVATDAARSPDAVTPPPDAWSPPDAVMIEPGDCSLESGNVYVVTGEPGEYITGGLNLRSEPGSRWRAVRPGATYLQLDVQFGSNFWRFEFRSEDELTPLHTGLYERASRAAFRPEGEPGIEIGGGGRGGTVGGSFFVHEITVVDGVVRSFRASFEHFTRIPGPALRGCIRYAAP